MTIDDDECPPDYTPAPSGDVAAMPSRPLPTVNDDAGRGQTEAMTLREQVIIDALKGTRGIMQALLERATTGHIDPETIGIENARTAAAKAFLGVAMAPSKAIARTGDDDVLSQLADELRARRETPPPAEDDDGDV